MGHCGETDPSRRFTWPCGRWYQKALEPKANVEMAPKLNLVFGVNSSRFVNPSLHRCNVLKLESKAWSLFVAFDEVNPLDRVLHSERY